jgi:hypothetical protein
MHQTPTADIFLSEKQGEKAVCHRCVLPCFTVFYHYIMFCRECQCGKSRIAAEKHGKDAAKGERRGIPEVFGWDVENSAAFLFMMHKMGQFGRIVVEIVFSRLEVTENYKICKKHDLHGGIFAVFFLGM